MDPIRLIVTALSARTGATHQGDRAPAVLPEAQAQLMTLARQRLRGRPNGSMVLSQHAEDPRRWARPLAKALEAEGAGGDAGLIAAAQAVLRLTDEAGSSRGKYLLDTPSPSGQAPG
jgi:tRNA G37 N-methylase TrmD